MKIILNSMVRDESHHAQSAMAHFTTLFDEINVVDHLSKDTTVKDISKWDSAQSRVNLFSFEEPGFYQSELMTHFAREQIKSAEADWVFFLDFDEYLPFKSRDEFEQTLIQHAEHPVIQMYWHNLIPVKYDRHRHLSGDYFIGPDASAYCKAAFQPKMMRGFPEVTIEQGNHVITYGDGKKPVPATPAAGLFHIPIDGLSQLKTKIEVGTKAYQEHKIGDKTALGSHWANMQELMEKHKNPVHLLNGFIAYYGESRKIQSALSDGKLALTHADLAALKFRKLTLDVAGAGVKLKPAKSDRTAQKNVRKLKYLPDGSIEVSGGPVTPQIKTQIKTVKSYAPENGVKIPKLPVRNPLLVNADGPKTLDDFIGNSFHRIETLTQTAWAGHIPFMFSLISCLRPRRYVELGTHCGASFFAACQIFKQLDLPSLGIAVDLWGGDHQAGYYGEEVYDNFEYLRKTRYKDQSRSVRSCFTEAAKQFDDHSVDLIHIDGLHTYEAVQEDYEVWRPKLTKNGVIIFHDTSEFKSTFGVWDFFASIRKEATASFELKHTHGLGILAFGDSRSNPMISILKKMNAEPVRTERVFAHLGNLAIAEALLTLRSQSQSHDKVSKIAPQDTVCIGVSTKTLARVLVDRVKYKTRSVIRNRIGI